MSSEYYKRRRFSHLKPSKCDDIDPEKLEQLAHRKVIELDLLPIFESMKVPSNCKISKDTMDFVPSSLCKGRLDMGEKIKRKRFYTDVRQAQREGYQASHHEAFQQEKLNEKVKQKEKDSEKHESISNFQKSNEKLIDSIIENIPFQTNTKINQATKINEEKLIHNFLSEGVNKDKEIESVPFVRDHQEDRMMLGNNPTRIWKRRLSNNAERHAREILERRQIHH